MQGLKGGPMIVLSNFRWHCTKVWPTQHEIFRKQTWNTSLLFRNSYKIYNTSLLFRNSYRIYNTYLSFTKVSQLHSSVWPSMCKICRSYIEQFVPVYSKCVPITLNNLSNYVRSVSQSNILLYYYSGFSLGGTKGIFFGGVSPPWNNLSPPPDSKTNQRQGLFSENWVPQ